MNPNDPEWQSPFDDEPAPDANEPGDNELPAELAEHVHEGDIVPDHVDKEEVETDGE